MRISSDRPGLRRRPVSARARWGSAVIWLVAVALGGWTPGDAGAEDRPLPESNLSLLNRSLDLVAAELLDRASLPPGTRLAIATEGERGVDADMEHALLNALTERGFEAWSLSLPAAGSTPAGSAADNPVVEEEISADLRAAREARMRALGMDPDSLASSGDGPAGDSGGRSHDWLSGVAVHLPVLFFEVEEARVDYPRMYRSGVFGGQHVERRAMARVTARLLRAETRAVYWVGVADTSVSDVVPRSDLRFLEDKTRAETRGTVPTSDWTKIAEPALVVGLVVGLVALFYSNRP